MASYYCGICHLWDNNSAHKIYHLPVLQPVPSGAGSGLGLLPLHAVQHLHASGRFSTAPVPETEPVPHLPREPVREHQALQGALLQFARLQAI